MTIYDDLAVRRVINAAGTNTRYGGSRLTDTVQAAMIDASHDFVDVTELNDAVGRYLATVTGAEAAMVTSGAASAVVLATAACLARHDPAAVRALPGHTRPPNHVIVQRAHQNPFTRLPTLAGAHLRWIGTAEHTSPADLDAAADPSTIAVLHVVSGPSRGLDLDTMVRVAHRHDLPVIVDAAGALPPMANLTAFTASGADLVQFSGGKYLRGPQNSGILTGRRDLIEIARTLASPNIELGRPHKVSRETIAGLHAAVREALNTDHDGLMSTYRARLEPIVAGLTRLPHVTATIEHDDHTFRIPSILVTIDHENATAIAAAVQRGLIDADPPIALHQEPPPGALVVNPFNLCDADVPDVAERLRDHLTTTL
ncbi:aminotransferase class V-fold PLP-dependent enzyme [Jiangella gansuensis]|uniref:aminotransferase class V-fold PLP-dependent enzyme n=1 Tax=Jiangella gansuensis TaxID=281473 RepID=UPI0004B8580E|nr:aminotransferase class V-fold PLP-dependent enzyme [Jiangella gansuensis]